MITSVRYMTAILDAAPWIANRPTNRSLQPLIIHRRIDVRRRRLHRDGQNLRGVRQQQLLGSAIIGKTGKAWKIFRTEKSGNAKGASVLGGNRGSAGAAVKIHQSLQCGRVDQGLIT